MEEMYQVLAREHLNRYANDRLIWSFDKNGEFSVKSLSKQIMEKRVQPVGINAFSFTKSIWKGLVPPKVEILTWFVLLGRVNTKSRLHRLGILAQDQSLCTFCGFFAENHEHLFFSCEYAWFLWCFWLKKWGVSWVFPFDQKCCFESWMEIKMRGPRKKGWWVAFFVVLWTIWRCRNLIIFEKKNISKEEALEMAKFWFNQWSDDTVG